MANPNRRPQEPLSSKLRRFCRDWCIIIGSIVFVLAVIFAFHAASSYFPPPKSKAETSSESPPEPEPQEIVSKEIKITPSKYELNLLLSRLLQHKNPGTYYKFTGMVQIHIQSNTNIKTIKLKAYNCKVNAVEIIDMSKNAISTKSGRSAKSQADVILSFDKEIFAERSYILRIKFSGQIKYDSLGQGGYVSVFDDTIQRKPGVQDYYLMFGASWEGIRLFPCFDSLDFKTLMKSKITVKDGSYVSASSTNVTNRIGDATHRVFEFKETGPIPAYRYGIFVGDTVVLKKPEKAEYAIIFVGRNKVQELYKNFAEIAYGAVAERFKKFEQNFLISPNLKLRPKLEIIIIPELECLMQNMYGLIYIPEEICNTRSEIAKQQFYWALTERLAQQSFIAYGALLKKADTWILDGFSNYYQYWYDSDELDEMDNKLYIIVKSVLYALKYRADEVLSIKEAVTEVDPMWNMANIEKSGSIILMLSTIVGDSQFVKCVLEYLVYQSEKQTLDFSKALFDYGALKYASTYPEKKDFEALIETWISYYGYPVVTVSVNRTTNSIFVQQNIFRYTRNSRTVDRLWHIPLRFGKQIDVPLLAHLNGYHYILKTRNVTIENVDPQDLTNLATNMGLYGYFRINYDNETWNEIIKDDKKKPLSEIKYGRLLDDAFHLALAKYLTYDTPFTLLKNLRYMYADYVVWAVASENLKYLLRLTHTDSCHETLKNFIISLVDNVYTQLDKQNNSLKLQHIRAITSDLACRVGHEECVKKSKIPKNPLKQLHPDTRDTECCNALRVTDDKAEFDKIFKLVRNRNISIGASARRFLVRCLTCTTLVEAHEELMTELIFNGRVFTRREKQILPKMVLENGGHNGRKVALDEIYKAITTNKTEMSKHLSWQNFLFDAMEYAAISSDDLLQSFNKLFELVKDEMPKHKTEKMVQIYIDGKFKLERLPDIRKSLEKVELLR